MDKKYLIAGAVGVGLVALFVVRRHASATPTSATDSGAFVSPAISYSAPASGGGGFSSGDYSSGAPTSTDSNALQTQGIYDLMKASVNNDLISQALKTLGSGGGTVSLVPGANGNSGVTITPTDQFADAKKFIDDQYATVLGKAPGSDAAGESYWLDQYKSGTQTLGQIANHISTIKTNADAVNNLYTSAGKTPDAGGVAYWRSQLDSGKSLDQVTKDFQWSINNPKAA